MNPAPFRGFDESAQDPTQQPGRASMPCSIPMPALPPGLLAGLARQLIAGLPIAVALIDSALRLRWLVLPPGRRAVWDGDPLVGQSVQDLLGNGADTAVAALSSVLASGQPFAAEMVPLRWPAGEEVSCWDVTLQPVVESGAIAGILAFGIDVSSRAARDGQFRDRIRRLEEQSRLQGDFLAVASHELRAPLTSMVGYAELLEENLAGVLTEEQADFVRHLRDNAQRLQRIVDDILDFTRFETGTFQLDLQAADMREVVHDAVECLWQQARGAGVELEWIPPAEPMVLRADPVRLGQVLLNLLGNALKFTAQGGKIMVTVKSSGGKVRVEIRDTGIGISRSHLSRLFDKFYQVTPQRTGRKGAGLGLAICKVLIEAHGGQIGVRSRPGRGSTFWFTVPADGPVDWKAERQLKLFA